MADSHRIVLRWNILLVVADIVGVVLLLAGAVF